MLFCPEWSHGHSGSGVHTALFSSPGGTKLSANRRGSACLVPHRWRRVLQCLSCSSDSRSAVNHDSWMRFRQPNRKGDRSKAGMVDHGFSTLRIFTCTTSGFPASTACPRLSIEQSQGPVFLNSFNGDRLFASGQIDRYHLYSTNYRVRFVPCGQ